MPLSLLQCIVCSVLKLFLNTANINKFHFFRFKLVFILFFYLLRMCSKACPLNCKQSAVFCTIKYNNKPSLTWCYGCDVSLFLALSGRMGTKLSLYGDWWHFVFWYIYVTCMSHIIFWYIRVKFVWINVLQH